MQDAYFKISDVYLAYKKAKSDAFFESIHCDALAYSRYEKKLDYNLRSLHKRLCLGGWGLEKKSLGGHVYAPKSIKPAESWSELSHFTTGDPTLEWQRKAESSADLARASFRLTVTASVDWQVINALWILKAGHKFDAILDKTLTFGNRLRRRNSAWWDYGGAGEMNRDSLGLFLPYFGAYQAWRQNGLDAMRAALESGRSIVAATMDARSFYHNLSPKFLLRKEFLSRFEIDISEEDRSFTSQLLDSLETWYESTPDFQVRQEGALPVGLSSSKIIANVALAGFDSDVNSGINPIYYGRYVDDIFLVVEAPVGVSSNDQFFCWLSDKVGPALSYEPKGENKGVTTYKEGYLEDSVIQFSPDKQKVFLLNGESGLDLVGQIEHQIGNRSSEYRLLPDVPSDSSKMLSRALIASPDATLEADALRKADAVSVKRLGFAMLLGDIEAYARDLDHNAWKTVRHDFYAMAFRHVVTPVGMFDYFSYIVRVSGVMAACRDFEQLSHLIRRISEICKIVEITSDVASSSKFSSCKYLYAKSLFQTVLQASTVKGFSHVGSYLTCLKEIRRFGSLKTPPLDSSSVRGVAMDLLMTDLGRRPYKEFWVASSKKADYPTPKVPTQRSIRRELRLAGVRRFRRHVIKSVPQPHWPAIAFPTRPLTVPEISAIAPSLLDDEFSLKRAIFSLRGARTVRSTAPSYRASQARPNQPVFHVPSEDREQVRVGIVSFLTADKDWSSAFSGYPNKSLDRYRRFNRLVNDVLRAERKIDYVVFPEASVPRRWAFSAASKLAKSGISFIAGLENNSAGKIFKNEALISMATRWPGYVTNVTYLQPKILPAHVESKALRGARRRMSTPTARAARPIYRHGHHFFGVVICSDLTNIDNRRHFQGCVDTLFVLEWNKDIESFSSLVESAAQDLHAYVVQVNSRQYGDSRARYPGKASYMRDLVRVKGGDDDYFVVAPLDIRDLKKFHSSKGRKENLFKPLPVGFKPSDERLAVAKIKRK